MIEKPSFFAEIKRRNVIRMAGLYLVGAWLLTQVASTVLPMFAAPDWMPRTIVVLLAMGFIPALVLSWIFELTPQGLRRDEDVAPEQSIAPQTARRMDRMIIVVLLLALGYFAADKFVFGPRRDAAATASSAVSSAALQPNGSEVHAKSIAVLPFENLSEEKANAFFATGIQDEILTRLAKIGDLKVISRTSTQQYQSKPESLTLIARQLGVANILEGSVQKVGDQVHITVQLIEAATDAHLWAESYDRELRNIFGVEGEVAGAIAEALRAKLTGSEKRALAEQPTQNLAAYAAYLRARSIEQSQWSYAGWENAAATYAEAVQLDPAFGLAWARLAGIRSLLYFNGSNLIKNSPASVKEPADHAIALQPELGEAWVAQGDYRYRVLRDFAGGLQAYDEAGKRLPNSSLVFSEMASVERRLGRWQDAEVHFRKAAEIDPRNIQIFEGMGGNFFGLLRRFDEAQTALDQALRISPNDEDVLARKAGIFQREGRLDEARGELARISASSTNEVVADCRIVQAMYERRYDDGIALIHAALGRMKPGESFDSTAKYAMLQLAYLQQWAGRSNEATKAFTEALQAIRSAPNAIVAADNSGMPSRLAEVYAGLGDKDEALAQAHRSVTQYADDAMGKPDAEATLAQIQARFGDPDSAVAALPHLLSVPAGITAAELRLDPRWDPLRSDPRFQALVAGHTGRGKDAVPGQHSK